MDNLGAVSDATSLTSLDVSLFLLTLAVSVLIGVYFANKNESISEYMLGGHDQKLLPVSLSMMTSFVSGLTLVGSPAELYYHGILYTTVVLAVMLCAPIVAFVFLPVFWRLKCTSVLEYLELRYSNNLKRFMSLVFILQMSLYNAVVLYVPSLSLQEVLGISEAISIGAVGVSCILYSSIGGIKAVIWTDFFQSAVMYFSLLCICVGGTIEVGGLSKLFEINITGGRLSFEPFLNVDLTTRHTVITVLVGATIIKIFLNGVNQVQIQRSLSLRTLREAQWAQLVSALFVVAIFFIASYVGLILYAIYGACDPFENKELGKRDALVIYYISTHLTNFIGLRGIFVAGVFAATLSTLSSFQNSMAALVMEDFLKPTLEKRRDLVTRDRAQLYLSKILAFSFGLFCLALTFAVGRVSGLLQVANLLFGALGAPFVAAYLMGMLTRFTNTLGMTVGVLVGYAVGVYIQIYQTFYLPPLAPTLPLSTSGCSASGNSNSTTSWLEMNIQPQPIAASPYDLLHMSYFWLPIFAMSITMLVAALVSLLTGGWRQQVENKYLVKWLHSDSELELDYHSSSSKY